MSNQAKHNHFIPSPFKVVTQYEDAFIKDWKQNTKDAVMDVLEYVATATADAIKNKDDFKPEEEDQEVIKSFFDELGDDIQKARVVGDVINYNGKAYVWTEYAPGKFDWHVLNKQGKVVEGVGYNGKHGVNALKDIYSQINPYFTDPSKMSLKRTPKGYWRLSYDGQDTGEKIYGNIITESELKNDNILYQRRKVVDNFNLVKNYMEFNSPDDVYFVQVTKRWKDNQDKPEAWQWKMKGKAQGTYHSGAEYLEYYLIHSPEDLDKIRDEVIKSCNKNNARAYITINSRSVKQTEDYIKKLKSKYSPNDPRNQKAEPIAYGMAKSGSAWKDSRFKVLLDIDTLRDTQVTIKGKKVNVWDEVKDRIQKYNIKVAAEYETPSDGLHLILNNKNNKNLKPFFEGLKDFDGGRDKGRDATVHPSEDIKMVLYSNVDTAGY